MGREVGIAAGRVLSPLVQRGMAFIGGGLSPRAVRALEAAGIDPATVDQEVRAHFQRLARRAGETPETAARAEAESLGVSLSRGQATGNFEDLAFEEAARHGARGEAARRTVQAGRDMQGEEIEAARDAMVGPRGMDQLTAVEGVHRGAMAMADRHKQVERVLWDTLPEGATIPVEMLDRLEVNVMGRLRDQHGVLTPAGPAESAVNLVRGMNREINEMDGVVGADVRVVEETRKRINRVIRGTQAGSAERFQAQEVLRAFDEWFDETIASGLINGGPEAYQALRAARQATRSFHHLYDQRSPRDSAGRMLNAMVNRNEGREMLQPADLVRYMVGASATGAAPHSRAMAMRLRSIFGTDSDEWQMLRRAAWDHVTRGTKPSNPKGRRAIQSGITDFLDGAGRNYASVLFTEAERARMRKLARVIGRTLPPAEATNPSKSGYEAARAVQSLWGSMMGVMGVATGNPGAGFGARIASEVARDSANRSRAIRSMDPRGERTITRGAAGAGVVGGSGAALDVGMDWLDPSP